jgi:opacity protein-like surface antigen
LNVNITRAPSPSFALRTGTFRGTLLSVAFAGDDALEDYGFRFGNCLRTPMTKKRICFACGVTAGLVGSFSLRVAAQNLGEDELTPAPKPVDIWSVDLVPYLWLASYDGAFGLPNLPSEVPPTHTDATSPFTSHLSAAAMLTAQVRYHDAGLFLDGAWIQVRAHGDSGSSLYSGTDIKSDIGYLTLALTYRLPAVGNLQTDLIAGARTWHISNEIEFQPGVAQGFTADGSVTWSDPVVGAKLRYDLTKHWFGTILGDVGGFDVGAKISWSVFGGVGYQFASWFSATLGYRYLHEDYDKDGFVMNVNVQGFVVGLGFRF